MVAFSIPQARLAELREGMAKGPVRVDAITGKNTLTGQVSFVENTIDTATGTILVKADVPNPHEVLWGGAFVNVQVVLPDASRRWPVVPDAAVQLGQKGSYVFVVKDGKTAELRPVTVARVTGADTVLTSGVESGEEVVVDGQLRAGRRRRGQPSMRANEHRRQHSSSEGLKPGPAVAVGAVHPPTR